MSRSERQREVAESACYGDCRICELYVETGSAGYRPASKADYLAALGRSYPNGIPARLIPDWVEQS